MLSCSESNLSDVHETRDWEMSEYVTQMTFRGSFRNYKERYNVSHDGCWIIWHVFKFGIKLSFDKQLSSGQDRKRKEYEDIKKTFLAGLPIKFDSWDPKYKILRYYSFLLGKYWNEGNRTNIAKPCRLSWWNGNFYFVLFSKLLSFHPIDNDKTRFFFINFVHYK